MKANYTRQEINTISSQQLFTLERNIQKGSYTIDLVGDYLPGNILVTDLGQLSTVYMNNSGCNILKHSVEELAEQGPEYFQRFFVPEETSSIIGRYFDMRAKQDPHHIFNFVHRVKPLDEKHYKWYYASAKLMYAPGEQTSDKIMLIVNEINSLGIIAKKINSVLEETEWMKKNFPRFMQLTQREKEIITMIVSEKSADEIADAFFISPLTLKTHRRNIYAKLQINSMTELYRFAAVYGLIN